MNSARDIVHDQQYPRYCSQWTVKLFVYLSRRQKGRVRVFKEEVRVRIFALIPCQNFNKRDFHIIIDVDNASIFGHHNYMIRKPLTLIQLLLIIWGDS